jgi:uncharacterized membrane protein (DUF2068 family)
MSDDGERRDVGVRLIVTYKAVKAAAEVLAALALVALAASGELATVQLMAAGLRDHLASEWSLSLAGAIEVLLSPHGTHLVELGLAVDGVLTAVEGWSLRRGAWWGPWFVVVATALPLPWELYEIARALSAARIALAAVNVAVILYLVRRIARRQHG